MKAVTWHGKNDIRVERVDDPKLIDDRDAIIRITSTAICGSDLHLMSGAMPTMEKGDVLGHEPMGIVEEVGKGVTNLKKGDRVVVPFVLACGQCWFCQKELYSACDNSNPNPEIGRAMMGHAPAGLLGYSHLTGGFAGGQAQLLRVPYADVGPLKVESDLPDEMVLFLSDIYPTGYMAAENAGIEEGDIVAVWGCGPVGQFAIRSAKMFNPSRIIAIDTVPERLRLAETAGAETIDFMEHSVYDKLMEMTANRGPDRCIDAVGAESHGAAAIDAMVDYAKTRLYLGTDRPHVLREAIMCCRKGGTISIPGVYIGMVDKMPMGAAMNKGLTFKMGQTHMQKYMKPLLKKIESGEIDPSAIITHTAPLEEAPSLYERFRDKTDGCIKVVLKPN